jgi:uncharacterized RDD family membrane protein YckC
VTAYQSGIDPTAVMGRRIAAWVVDALIASALVAAVFAATISVETIDFNPCPDTFDDFGDDGFGSSDEDFQVCTYTTDSGREYLIWWDGEQARGFQQDDSYLIWGASALYSVLVFWVLQGLTGATPGKALFGIRTVDEAGTAPGIGRAAIRSILWIVDGIGCCIPLVAPIAAFSSKGHRRVGDMVAKTFVVDRSSMGAGPIQVPGLTAPEGGTPPAAAVGAWGTTPPMSPPMGAVAQPPQAAEPQWDAQRNAYIQWDDAQQQWLQFDDASQQWRPIS